jgi:hypothetical protein
VEVKVRWENLSFWARKEIFGVSICVGKINILKMVQIWKKRTCSDLFIGILYGLDNFCSGDVLAPKILL